MLVELFPGPAVLEMILSERTPNSCKFSITAPTEGDTRNYEMAFKTNDGSYVFESLKTEKTFTGLTASSNYTFSAKFEYTTAEGDSAQSEPVDFTCNTGYKRLFIFLIFYGTIQKSRCMHVCALEHYGLLNVSLDFYIQVKCFCIKY